jgi:hypothetical protein
LDDWRLEQVAKSINDSNLTTQQIRRLAFKSVIHAYYVNRSYWTDRTFFGERVSVGPLVAMNQIIATFEDALKDKKETIDHEGIWDLMKQANPDPDDVPGILPGWAALLNACVEALGEEWESYYWSMGNAYQSVANRSYCELRGIEGNCGFGAGEDAAEANDELCSQEIRFQLESLTLLAD